MIHNLGFPSKVKSTKNWRDTINCDVWYGGKEFEMEECEGSVVQEVPEDENR